MAKIDQSNGQNNKILSMEDKDKNLVPCFAFWSAQTMTTIKLTFRVGMLGVFLLSFGMYLTTKQAEIDHAQGTEPAVPNR